jgi:predicted nucleotidyltransferase component of viral defense system
MDLKRIRTLTITALFSDDTLFDLIVLKGGNALNLVYDISPRTSLDLDFSIAEDFPDIQDAVFRMKKALREKFASFGLIVFDERFEARPLMRGDCQNARWGGYRMSFKLIEHAHYTRLKGDLDSIRREAVEIGPEHLRTFIVDFSKFEYCEGREEIELEDYTIRVYSPSMIAVEKLRAICQQMPEYRPERHPHPRARDFFDIHELVENAGVRFSTVENLALTKAIFGAKNVPFELIPRIIQYREFHRPDWPAVEASVNMPLRSFDFYFEFVVAETKALKSLWIEDAPL